MRLLRVLTGLCLAVGVLFTLSSCGGGGIGTSFGRQPGIYLVDQGNDRIVWVSDMNAQFFNSFDSAHTGVANIVNGSVAKNGRIYLIDASTKSIVRFDDLAGDGRAVFGSQGSGTGQFLNPVRIAADGQGRLLVVDRDRNALIRWNLANNAWEVLDLSPWYLGSDEPDVTTDSFGKIYLGGGSKIVELAGMTATGALTYGTPGTGNGQFNDIKGIALDDTYRIYVADGVNNRIVRINDIGGGGFVAYGSLGGGVDQFNIPFGIGVDHFNRIYVGDRNNHRLVRVDSMTGTNWTELDSLPSGSFSFPLSVFPHLPNW